MESANLTDHDLLIRLDTRLEGITDEMRALRDGTKDDIKNLQNDKLDRREFEAFKIENERARAEKIRDFNDKAERIENDVAKQGKKVDYVLRVVYVSMGILGTIQFVAPFVMRYIFSV